MAEIRYFAPAVRAELAAGRIALIEASAGTGKTHAIAHLALDLLLSSGLKLEQILVVTFTERATSELRAKIRTMLERVARGLPPDDAKEGLQRVVDETGRRRLTDALFTFAAAPILTIHAFCRNVLADLGFDSGMLPALELIDGRREFHRAFRAELRETFAISSAERHLLREWLAQEKNNTIDRLEDLLAEAYRRRAFEVERPASKSGDDIERRAVDLFLPPIAERLEREKQGRGQLDYDDMLAWTWRALDGPRSASLIAAIRDRYRCALVDEFQDTDDLQWRILRRIFSENDGGAAYLIGDPKQAIYAFRGADVHAYLAARRELVARGIKPVALTQNFRSTADMIDALKLIFQQEPAAPFFTGAITYDNPVECARKELAAVDADGQPVAPVTLLVPKVARKLPAAEARELVGRTIAATVRRVIDGALRIRDKDGERRVEPGNIFVLTRSNPECEEIGTYLREADVPFAFYKQEGLFERGEAADILDALRAADDPTDRSARFKAWVSPFFAVPFERLWALGEIDAAHPLMARLLRWHALGADERFGELFDEMLHESGLVQRALLLANSERELANYQHIFELLLSDALRGRLSLGEIIDRLAAYIADRARPPGEDSAVMRLASEGSAVQVMTIHKSKGLEAEVVALFGGTHRGSERDQVFVYHEGLERRLAIGQAEKSAVDDLLDREEWEENQRLLYVACTRAGVQLYLPFFPDGSISALTGAYKPLNERLAALRDQGAFKDRRIFQLLNLSAAGADGPDTVAQTLRTWTPPERFLSAGGAIDEARFDALRDSHAPLKLHSYTTLSRRAEFTGVEPEDFKSDLSQGEAGEPELPGGRSVGLFLHELIEKLDLPALAAARDLESWRSSREVSELIEAAMRRHRVRDPRWRERGAELVFNTLTAPLKLGDAVVTGGLAHCESVREMEFVFPIPEAWHPLLESAGPRADGNWRAERGFLTGFVDFVFQLNGLTYFADWKSDLLRSWATDALEEHVRRNYDLQARIYSVGVVRLLGITGEREYHERFGGLVYVFLRGIEAAGGERGIYFRRPAWTEIVEYEAALGSVIRGFGS